MADLNASDVSYSNENQLFERVPNARETLNVPQRIRDRSEKSTPRGVAIRKRIDQALENIPSRSPNESLDSESLAGFAINQGIAAANDYVPGDVGADTEIVAVEDVGDATQYTIDVDSALESQAKIRSIVESSVGITGLWTEDITVEDVSVKKRRPVRDTYRYVVTVE